MIPVSKHPGYAFLMTVLVTGMIASASAVSLLMLAWAAEQNGYLFWESAQAYEYAQTCAERTLRTLRSDLSYAGGEAFSFAHGSCSVLPMGGSGNADRTLCVQGSVGQATRRSEIRISQLLPTTRIASWQEVDSFSACP